MSAPGSAAEFLGAYARASLARARALAARLHATELSPEHWLAALLEDEGCAATRVVLHAFADPETIGVEVLALCEGIMVVGSDRTLPFSVRGVEALRAARAAAAARKASRVEPDDVFAAALVQLPPALARRLEDLGLNPAAPAAEEPGDGAAVPAEGPLFRAFAGDALRALASSARAAGQLGRTSIGPVHLLIGALEASAALRERCRLSAARLRLAVAGQDEDSTPLPDRHVPDGPELGRLLAGLAPGAQTIDVLAWLLEHGTPELTALLRRQKVTPTLLERCRGAFQDPDEAL